jgi:N-terminal domain of anti-restriction factor ArdC
MLDNSSTWQQLLNEAITKPGLLAAAYNSFHSYSIGNQVLAMVQCQQRGITPGPIATFPAWKEKSRHVKKGEKALTLCMPVNRKNEDDETYTSFIYRNRWFVLSQTEGEEIEQPTPPTWDKARALAELGISEVPFDLTDGNVMGYAKKRSIAISPLAFAPFKTLFHELAHVILNHTEELDFSDSESTPKSLREVEAESVALILCESLNLPGAEHCRGYIQSWLAGDVIPEKSAQKIFRAADRILKAGAPEATAEAT